MASKKQHDAARARAAKEKKLLAMLVVPLLGAGFFAYHTLSKLHHSSPPLTPAAATTPVSSVQTETAPAPTAPVVPVADTGLSSLSHLASKDPFHDQGPRTGTKGGSGPAKAKKQAKQKQKPTPKVKVKLPPPTMALIAVNGKLTGVALGSSFGSAPGFVGVSLFRLVGLTQRKAEIRVVGSSAAPRWLVRGRPLKLTFSGWSYTLLLQTTGWPSGAPATPTPTTPTTTTTTPTG